MSPRRFLVVFALSVGGVAAGAVAVNLIVDPLGISPATGTIGGVNQAKVARSGKDQLHKPIDVVIARPRTVVVGTSRILQAFDPDYLAGTQWGPAYNYGFPGANIDEVVAHFEQFIVRSPKIEHVYVELFFPVALTRSEPHLDSYAARFAKLLFSWSALHDSLETVWANRLIQRRLHSSPPWVLQNGMQNYLQISPLNNFRAYPAYVAGTAPRYIVDDALAVPLTRMRRAAEARSVDLVYFVSPMHAIQLHHLYQTGNWPAMEQWKRLLARDPDVRDFSSYNSVTAEPISGDMRFWMDPNHFTPRTAELILDALTGRRSPGLSNGFGDRLTPATVEQRLLEWRAGREAWIAAHPDWAARLAPGHVQAAEPDGDVRRCPFAFGSHVPYGLTPVGAIDQWVVASIKTNRDRLEISVEPDPGARGLCRLTITAAPASRTPGTVAWRMGKVLQPSFSMTGRVVRLTVRLQADRPMLLDSASLYLRDADAATEIALPSIGPVWRTLSLTHRIGGTSQLEVGIRLLRDKGTIQPSGEHYLRFAAAIDVDVPGAGGGRALGRGCRSANRAQPRGRAHRAERMPPSCGRRPCHLRCARRRAC
jgi:hypothetical protein